MQGHLSEKQKEMKIGLMRNESLFLKEGLTHPFLTGSLHESSPSTVAEIVKRTTSTMRQVVVECGAGTGVIAEGLTAEGVLTPDSILILIEKNKTFANELRKTMMDLRVRIFEDSAVNIGHILGECGEEAADVVISSLPYSVMWRWNRQKIVREIMKNLRIPNGRHIVFNINSAIEKTLRKYHPYVAPPVPLNDEKNTLTLYEALVTPHSNGNGHTH